MICNNLLTDIHHFLFFAEGLQIADRLKVKFWLDTPLVSFISPGWLEKQLNDKKKELENGQGPENGNSPGGTHAANKNKLLIKKRIAKRKLI